MKLDMGKRITTTRGASVAGTFLFFALGFGLGVMLAGQGRWDIIAGALVLGGSLYVGTK